MSILDFNYKLNRSLKKNDYYLKSWNGGEVKCYSRSFSFKHNKQNIIGQLNVKKSNYPRENEVYYLEDIKTEIYILLYDTKHKLSGDRFTVEEFKELFPELEDVTINYFIEEGLLLTDFNNEEMNQLTQQRAENLTKFYSSFYGV